MVRSANRSGLTLTQSVLALALAPGTGAKRDDLGGLEPEWLIYTRLKTRPNQWKRLGKEVRISAREVRSGVLARGWYEES